MKNNSLHYFVAVLIVFSLSLAGCTGSRKEPAGVPAGARSGDLVDLESCRYRMNKINYAAECVRWSFRRTGTIQNRG